MDNSFINLDILKLILKAYCKNTIEEIDFIPYDFELENNLSCTCRKLRQYYTELQDQRFKDYIIERPIYMRLCLYQLKNIVKFIDYNLLERVTYFIYKCDESIGRFSNSNSNFHEFICNFLFEYCYMNGIINHYELYSSSLILDDIPSIKGTSVKRELELISNQVNASGGQILSRC